MTSLMKESMKKFQENHCLKDSISKANHLKLYFNPYSKKNQIDEENLRIE